MHVNTLLVKLLLDVERYLRLKLQSPGRSNHASQGRDPGIRLNKQTK